MIKPVGAKLHARQSYFHRNDLPSQQQLLEYVALSFGTNTHRLARRGSKFDPVSVSETIIIFGEKCLTT